MARQLFIDPEKAYNSIRKVLYNIITEFCTPMKIIKLIKMHSN
jgi:hypothetical protein